MLRVGIIGLGGFAQSHHKTILKLEQQGLCKLLCTCDPAPDAFQDKMTEWEFEGRGVKVFDHYLKMLDEFGGKLDVCTIPTPVPLHAEMHKACVERGIAVYLEKPPTVNYAELDEMLQVDSKAKKATMVGFNFIVEQSRQELKKRILAGEFGAIEEVQFRGMWPRNVKYFGRAAWPARLMMDGRLVLDSCMSNAMAHYVHNTLFWCGKGELLSWGRVAETGAELYRAHEIEGFDTVFASGKTDAGEGIRVSLSHALSGKGSHCEKVICEKATLTYVVGQNSTIEWRDGRVETDTPGKGDNITENMRLYLNYVNGDVERPLTRLIDSKPFVEFCDLVYIASGSISQVPESHIERSDGWVAIKDLRGIVDKFFETDLYPSGQGIKWAKPGGHATPADLPKLRSVIESML
jgi:predicted dehydrogenase